MPAAMNSRPRSIFVFANRPERRTVSAFLVILLLTMAAPAIAGERRYWVAPTSPADVVTRPSGYPGLSGSVLASDDCWRACESSCGGSFNVCLRVHPINACRDRTDSCDRSCLKHCRTYGGPIVNFLD
jgi:hypothetical protein